MASIFGILQNGPLIAAMLAWFTAETMKLIIRFFHGGMRTWPLLWGSGGMPSAHSATVCALALSIGWQEGFDGYPFAIAAVLALIVMYDACGVRMAAGKQARALNVLRETLASTQAAPEKKLRESIGHTRLQVVAGALWGMLVATLLTLFLFQ